MRKDLNGSSCWRPMSPKHKAQALTPELVPEEWTQEHSEFWLNLGIFWHKVKVCVNHRWSENTLCIETVASQVISHNRVQAVNGLKGLTFPIQCLCGMTGRQQGQIQKRYSINVATSMKKKLSRFKLDHRNRLVNTFVPLPKSFFTKYSLSATMQKAQCLVLEIKC